MTDYIELLKANRFMVLATVTPDSTPWNVPVTYVFLNNVLYWRSAKEAIHSRNIENYPKVSISLFDAQPRAGQKDIQAAYIQSVARRIEGEEKLAILREIGDRFSLKDEDAELYAAPVGLLSEEKSTDSRFYIEYANEDRKV